MPSLVLPRADGGVETFTLSPASSFPATHAGGFPRTVYAAAHVVADPLADNDPWLTPYGWILGAKLCVVGVLLALAGYNRRRLTPRLLHGDTSAVQALRTTIGAELLLIAAVLTITSILTTYASPHD